MPRQALDLAGKFGTPPVNQPIEHARLGKAAHAHGEINQRAGASKVQYPAGAAQFGNPKVEVGGEAAVQADLLRTKKAPPLQGGKVKEAQVERFLQLVGAGIGQVNPGDMRFDESDAAGRFRVGGRIEQLPVDLVKVHCGVSACWD